MTRKLTYAARSFILGACALLALVTASCDQSGDSEKPRGAGKTLQPIEILLDWQAEPTYLGIYFAKHEGYFAKAGYSVTIIQSWGANAAVAAVAGGKYVIGTASGGATVLGRNNGANVISLGVLYSRIPSVVYGLAETGVHGPADLKGKRIGIYPGSITSNEFDAFLKLNGLAHDDVTIVSLSGPDIPLLLAHKVDAVLHYTEMSPVQVETDPKIPGVRGSKTFELKLADYGVGGYGLNIIANGDTWIKQKPQLTALSNAILLGYTNGCAHRAEATTAFAKEFPDKDPNYIRSSWDRVCDLVGAHPGTQNASGWQKTIDLYRSLGLLKTAVKPSDILGQ